MTLGELLEDLSAKLEASPDLRDAPVLFYSSDNHFLYSRVDAVQVDAEDDVILSTTFDA